MDKPISVGDLVLIARACCRDSEKSIGQMFTAGAPTGGSTCGQCGQNNGGPYFTDDRGINWSSWRLKRIPPLDELEGEKTQEPTVARKQVADALYKQYTESK